MSEQTTRLVPAICTQCGAKIDVDPSKDRGICEYCGTSFIIEKAINNYTTDNIPLGNRGSTKDAFDNKQNKQINKSKPQWFTIVCIVFMCITVISIFRGAKGENEEYDVNYTPLNTVFSSDTVIDTVGGGNYKFKYRVPSSWNCISNEDNETKIYYPEGQPNMRILCMDNVTKYASFSYQVDDIIDGLNKMDNTYNISLQEVLVAGDRKVGFAKGVMNTNNEEWEFSVYILPDEGRRVFEEWVIKPFNYDDQNIKDEQAVISSVLFP